MSRSKGISYGLLIIKNHASLNTKVIYGSMKIHPRTFCQIQEPPSPPSTSWKNWTTGAVGLMATMAIPFLQFKEDVDVAMETTEEIIDVVEVVAEAVDMVAEKIADDLPEGSKLKTTMELVEEAAEVVAGKAEKAIGFIDQVQETEKKLMPIIEPVKERTQVAP